MGSKPCDGVVVAVVVGVVLLAAAFGSAEASARGSGNARFAAAGRLQPAEACAGAARVADARNDTRSWTIPASPGPTVVPASADLLGFEVRATRAGVCVRWTTAAPAPPGTTFVFLAHGPWVREPNGAQIEPGYGFELELGKNSARATMGLARLGSTAPHVLRVRAGRTASVVSAFLRKEWLRPPANMTDGWAYVYRAFSFEVRVLSPPDSNGDRRVDFLPREGPGEVVIAGYLNGALCAPPCRDSRFIPH